VTRMNLTNKREHVNNMYVKECVVSIILIRIVIY